MEQDIAKIKEELAEMKGLVSKLLEIKLFEKNAYLKEQEKLKFCKKRSKNDNEFYSNDEIEYLQKLATKEAENAYKVQQNIKLSEKEVNFIIAGIQLGTLKNISELIFKTVTQ